MIWLVIWRLPHPARGIVTFLVILALGTVLGGFAMGLPELAALALLAAGAGLFVGTRTSGDRTASP
jgi:hypothetical protein